MTDMVPAATILPSTRAYGISHLLMFIKPEAQWTDEYDSESVWLFDTIIPPFQRQVVWDAKMMARFVDSIWCGLDIGRYVVNDAMDGPTSKNADGCLRWNPTDRWLIDGQQRLTAIHAYVSDVFPIRGADGRLHMWSDLPISDRKKFGNRPFDRAVVKVYAEHDLRVLYDLMNFSGVAHSPDQRALPETESGTLQSPGRY